MGHSGLCVLGTAEESLFLRGFLDLAAKKEQHSLWFEETRSFQKKKKKVGTHLIHQDDSYLGSLRLHSGPVPACEGLCRLRERKLPSPRPGTDPPVWVQRRLGVAIEITLVGMWNQVAENPGVRPLEGP